MKLVPCAACARHMKAEEARCPFCDAAVIAVAAPAPMADAHVFTRSRAALMFGAATLATAIGASCTPAPAYGGPPPSDTGHTTVTVVNAGADAGAKAPK